MRLLLTHERNENYFFVETTNFEHLKNFNYLQKANEQHEGQKIMSLITCLSRECVT